MNEHQKDLLASLFENIVEVITTQHGRKNN